MAVADQTPVVPTQPIPAKSLVIKTDKPRPYVCATCTRSFARLEHLKRHERSHTKEKPFQCPICERSFARRDLLLRHKQKLHANLNANSDAKRNSISGPCAAPGRRASIMSPSDFSPAFSPGFSPRSNGNNMLNPLEHELISPAPCATPGPNGGGFNGGPPNGDGRFSRSQSFSAVSGDSYLPDSAIFSGVDDNSATINPQMLRQPSVSSGTGPVHMGVRRQRRFNSNASTKQFMDSPDYSIASSLSQFDSPQTVPYQSPPTDFSHTPMAQQHHWAPETSAQHGIPALGMDGFDQQDDFVNNLLDLDTRFEAKDEIAPHEAPHMMDAEWKSEPIRGFSTGFGLLREANAAAAAHGHSAHGGSSHGGISQNDEANAGINPGSHLVKEEADPANPIDGTLDSIFKEQFAETYTQQQQQQQQHQHQQRQHHPQSQPQQGAHMDNASSPHSVAPSLTSSALGALEPLGFSRSAAPSGPSIGLQNLPSSQEVRRLVSAFYSQYHTHVLFGQHGHDLASQNMALVMAMACLGALILNEYQTAAQIFELSCECVWMFSDLNNISLNGDNEQASDVPIWLVQTSVLTLHYLQLTWSPATMDRMHQHASNLASLARRARLHEPPSKVLEVPGPNASIEDKYKYFMAAECRIRTMYAAYTISSFTFIYSGHAPTCPTSMLECGVPRDDNLVEAMTPEEWWKNPKVRNMEESPPFSIYFNYLMDGKLLDADVPPTVLLALILAIHQRFEQSSESTTERKLKIIHTWEDTWTNSKFAANIDRKDTKVGLVMSECAPVASLALMRCAINISPVYQLTAQLQFDVFNEQLDELRRRHPDELVDAASHALDAIVVSDEMNKNNIRGFLPSVCFVFESALILADALAVIEAMAQPVEKHQRLLMRAHKIFSRILESDIYMFASDALFNLRDPAESLSRMAIRVVVVIMQFRTAYPIAASLVEVLKKRVLN